MVQHLSAATRDEGDTTDHVCHACLFASETVCEASNRWLDRAVLVDLTGNDGFAFAP